MTAISCYPKKYRNTFDVVHLRKAFPFKMPWIYNKSQGIKIITQLNLHKVLEVFVVVFFAVAFNLVDKH